MDVLIQATGDSWIQDGSIMVGFRGFVRYPAIPNFPAVEYAVAYNFAWSAAQKRTAIINAGRTAADAYASSVGVTLPTTGVNIDIIGV